ncbi:MAG: hypothetical protein WCR19_05080 [Acholeplasmataceae bacterium]
MYYFLLLIPIAFVLYVMYQENKKYKKLKNDAIFIYKSYGAYDEVNHIFTYKDNSYKVIFYKVSSSAELVINSPKIWEIRSSSKPKLINQAQLLSDPMKKIIVIYPNVRPIKRYINENEMVFVKTSFFNNMYVISIEQIETLIKEMGK